MSEQPTDWSLVDRVRAGDDAAYDVLMGRHKLAVLNFVYRMIGDAIEAQDVAQDVFVRTYQSVRKQTLRQGKTEFSHWLFHVARNAALDCLRRRARHPEVPQETTAVPELDPRAVVPDREAGLKEIGERITAALTELPEDQRTAFVLVEYHAMPRADIAEVMGGSVKSVESLLYRAKQALRVKLADLLADR